MKPAVSIKNVLDGFFEEIGISEAVKSKLAIYYWNYAAGEKIAKVTKPVKVTDGKLFVKVVDDIWRNELFYYKGKLIKKLNKKLRGDYIKEIVFK